jgi:GMP synthase (glutamine-hydrolysing)
MVKQMVKAMVAHESAFDPSAYIQQTFARLGGLSGKEVLIAVSGGIDSTTSAALLRAVGVRGRLLMIDTGFLRDGEPAAPIQMLEAEGFSVDLIEQSRAFYRAVEGKQSSRERRAAFRELYFEILGRYMMEHGIRVIAQGSQFHKIIAKQAHNDPTQRFLENRFDIVEPVLGLTKSQVRAVARTLEVPERAVTRRPFPGPGLLLRFGGEFDRDKLELIRAATHVVDGFVHEHEVDFAGCYQIFPYLTDGEAVTYVDHDGRGGLGKVLLLRAVQEEYHAETIIYRPFHIPAGLQAELVERLMAIAGVARVCFDITPKFGLGTKVAPGATVEYA